MRKTFYITTPIYYPSGHLHIGHVFTTTLAWTIRNYKTKMGYDAKMLTGADEHGLKIQRKAEELKKSPQEYVDEMTMIFKDLWTKLEIDYDYYSRTTNENHVEAVKQMFSDLVKEDDIYRGEYEGLYSVPDEEFFTDSQAVLKDGEYYSPTSGHKLELVKEESYFLRMSKYQDWLIDYIKVNPEFIFQPKTVNELMNNFLLKGLEDLSVTRSTFNWGVPINEDPKHVVYVWLDALSNYITALGYGSDDETDFRKYWTTGSEVVHLVGKEITRFHCIYWPIMLRALGLEQPTSIISHGWIITPEGKMSKSLGNVVDPNALIDKYGPEVIKYYFSTKMSLDHDVTFSEDMIKVAYNSELANIFGNLLSRTTAMICQNFETGNVKYTKTEIPTDIKMEQEIEVAFSKFKQYFDAYELKDAFDEVVNLGRNLNGYIDVTAPWTLKENKERLEQVLNILLNGIFAVYSMLSIVIPNKAEQAMEQMGMDNLDFDNILDFTKFDKVSVRKGLPLFERMK